MPDIQIVQNKKNDNADAIETFYTSPATSRGTRINAFSATNDTETSHSYKAYIYGPSGSPSAVIPQTIVVRDTSDYGPSIINMVIPAGGTLRIESSDANSLNFNVSGLEQN